jgi:hypothetical protein
VGSAGLCGAPADEYDCVVDALWSRLVAHGSRAALLAALD